MTPRATARENSRIFGSPRIQGFVSKLAPFKDSFGSVLARGLVLPITGAATILSSRLVVDATGAVGFAWFSLLITLPLLIPISDFGIAAVLTDVIAKHGPGSRAFRDVYSRAMRSLCLISVAAVGAGVVLSVNGLWSQLLGLPSGVETEIACLALTISMALGIPLGAGQRVLLGLGRQSTSTLILGGGGFLSLGLVWILHQGAQNNFGVYGVAYALGPLVAQTSVAVLAWRAVRQTTMEGDSLARVPRVRIHRVAIPMAVISVALPLAYQSDRVVLAHVSTAREVAEYSLVAILYGPLLSIIAVGGQTLWPLFLRRTHFDARQSLYKQANIIFFVLGAVLACALVLLGPVISGFVSSEHDKIDARTSTYVLFGLILVMFAAHTTNGMLLMDEAGRRMQALGSTSLLLVKVPLSFFLAPSFGADGVLAATLLAAIPCLVLPAAVTARRRLQSQQQS